MNLLVLSVSDFPEEFPWDDIKDAYVLDTGTLDDYDCAEEANTYVVTSDASNIPEELLDSLSDVIEVDDPVEYVLSRGIPGDLACLNYDDSDESYRLLERLNNSGVTVLDVSDEWVEVVLDKKMDIEDLVNTITQRVTADVLRALRAEFGDTPPRRGRFRSPAPRA